MSVDLLGHEVLGDGPRRVVLMNDWLCDTSTWQDARRYMSTTAFSWAYVDLRGYGRSRGRPGEHTALEAAGDVLALVDALGWERFSVVGHSMSTYVAMHLGQHAAARVERVVLITPGPRRGFGADASWLVEAEDSTRDDARRREMVLSRFHGRHAPGWAEYKAARWLETSDAAAAAAYIAMYARDGLPQPDAPIAVPVLAITGEQDAPVMRKAAVEADLGAIAPDLEVVGLIESGHYPMQEMPPRTVGLVEAFLGA